MLWDVVGMLWGGCGRFWGGCGDVLGGCGEVLCACVCCWALVAFFVVVATLCITARVFWFWCLMIFEGVDGVASFLIVAKWVCGKF